MNWEVGKQLKRDRYLLENMIAKGSFGQVFKALDTENERNEVVIKTPLEEYRMRPNYAELVERLKNEADQLSRLRHPHIANLIDVFEEDEILCVVTAYIPGKTLYEIIQGSGAMPYEAAIAYISQIGSALSYIHQQKRVHRDVHPSNIAIIGDNAILIDFGLTTDIALVTNTYYHHGHDNFAPYEQRQGSAKPPVDIYALAAALYYAVTGAFPALASDRKNKPNEIHLIPPRAVIADLPDWLETAILKGMEVEPHHRPSSMREWLDLLTPPLPVKTSTSSTKSALSPISSQTKTRGILAAVTHTVPYGNPQRLKEIPWEWVVWSATFYAGLGAVMTAILLPRFLMAGASFLAVAWALSIVGNWAMRWVMFLTGVWLIGVLIRISFSLAALQTWFGIAWGGFIVVLAIVLWTAAKPSLEAMYRLLITAWNKTKSDLLKSFSKPHSFLILAFTNLGSLLLGGFLYTYFR